MKRAGTRRGTERQDSHILSETLPERNSTREMSCRKHLQRNSAVSDPKRAMRSPALTISDNDEFPPQLQENNEHRSLESSIAAGRGGGYALDFEPWMTR
jgi:hypothetical protein